METAYSQQMLDALSAGQLDEAQRVFALALRHDEDDMLFSLAEELYGLGFLKQAKRTYLKLLERYPDADEIRTGLADVAIDEDEIDEALGYLSEIDETSDSYVEALLVTADLYQTEELYEASEQKLLKAYELAPDEPVILFALAEFYFNTRQFKQAIAFYKEMLLQGLKSFSRVDIVSRIGVAYAQAGNFDNAIAYLEQIHEADMTPDVQFQLGFTYFQLKEWEKAAKAFEALEDMDNQYGSLYPYLGQAYIELNRLDDALRTFQAGLSVDEFNENLYRLAAETSIKLGDDDQARKYFIQGLNIEPDDTTMVLELSNLYVQKGDDDKNVELLSAYVQNDEIDPQIYWNAAKSLAKVDQWDLARKYWDAAQPYFMENADFLREAFDFWREDGDSANSIVLGQAYLKLEPEDTEMIDAIDSLENY